MTIGERIKTIRKEKHINAQTLAQNLGISVSTLYRYEDSSIEKIPVHIFDAICQELDVSPARLMGNEINTKTPANQLPQEFTTPQEAMEFMLRLPSFAAFGGYDPDNMNDDTIVEFANEILGMVELVSYKYKNKEDKEFGKI